MPQNPELYVSKVRFKTGEELSVSRNSIVVFVGPNNVGKSSCLRDIYSLLGKKSDKNIIVEKLLIHTPPSFLDTFDENVCDFDVVEYLDARFRKKDSVYQGLHFHIHESAVKTQITNESYGGLRDVFTAFVGTENRLMLCNPPENIDDDAIVAHPIHEVLRNVEIEKNLASQFHSAFNLYLVPERNSGKRTALRCLKEYLPLSRDSSKNSAEKVCEYQQELKKHPALHTQGDGMRSFAGLLLSFVERRFLTYIVDEPESFLHPPQAYLAGTMVPALLGDCRQAFIATHSSDFIKGLIDSAPERVSVVRILRDDDTNRVSFPTSQMFADLWQDPLMRFSNIMDGLFHEKVILCESDSDCKLYQAVAQAVSKGGKNSFFVHCGGKHRFKKILPPLRGMGIDAICVVDFDFFNDKHVVRDLCGAIGMNYAELEKDYEILEAAIVDNTGEVSTSDFWVRAKKIIGDAKFINDLIARKIRSAVHPLTFWDEAKEFGLSSIKDESARCAVERMIEALKKRGVFVVSEGQLESLIPEANGGHGPSWAIDVLAEHPDVAADIIYKKIKEFVTSFMA